MFAGYATLFIVISFFPFAMLIISIIGMLPGFSAEDATEILLRFLPDLDAVRELVTSVITNLKDQTSGLLASVAAVATLWSASKGVFAIQKGLDHMDKEEGIEPKKKVKGAGIMIIKRLLFTLLLVVMIPAMLLFDLPGAAVSALILLFSLLVILAIYTLLPAKRKTWKSRFPGAVFTVVCWFAFTELFSYFIPRFFNASLYGSLASVFLVFMWVWIMVIILFAGEILNRV